MNVFWTAGLYNMPAGTVSECSKNGCSGAPSLLASGQIQPLAIATDATGVYWTTASYGTGTVMKCAASGCAGGPITLAAGQDYPIGIAVDSTSVYWAEQGGGAVWKIAK